MRRGPTCNTTTTEASQGASTLSSPASVAPSPPIALAPSISDSKLIRIVRLDSPRAWGSGRAWAARRPGTHTCPANKNHHHQPFLPTHKPPLALMSAENVCILYICSFLTSVRRALMSAGNDRLLYMCYLLTGGRPWGGWGPSRAPPPRPPSPDRYLPTQRSGHPRVSRRHTKDWVGCGTQGKGGLGAAHGE
jgi:hypothetical protein